jgi:hypothetical protein
MNDRVLKDLDGAAKNEILSVIRKEINPEYTVMLWCGHCVAQMIEYVFKEADK